jgi:hypothetical protein
MSKSTRRFEIVSSDLKGPMLVPSKCGHRYYITFNCLYSKWCWITFLKRKSAEEVLDVTKRFIKDAESETKLRMTTLLTDNGSEYVNRDVRTFLLQKNIKPSERHHIARNKTEWQRDRIRQLWVWLNASL